MPSVAYVAADAWCRIGTTSSPKCGRAACAYRELMSLDARHVRSASLTRRLLSCGVAAGPVFVGVFLVEGARRADYSALRHPVSALSLGSRGWVQVANFAAVGSLYIAGASGLGRLPDGTASARLGPALIGAAGAGLIASGVFATEPVSGYPPGPPAVAVEPVPRSSPVGRHGLAAIPFVAGLPTAALTYAWRFHQSGNPRWAVYSALTAASMVTNYLLAAAGFGQAPPLVDRAGLFQRVSIVTAFSWITALCARALGSPPPRPPLEAG